MRCIMTRSGTEITLDGDLLAVVEAIDRALTDRHGLDGTFEDTMLEIRHVVEQMEGTKVKVGVGRSPSGQF